jgi:hypothetical protein
MAAKATTIEKEEKAQVPVAVLIVAWLLPGGGHLWQRRWGRGALLLASIGVMFALGLAAGGRFFRITPGNPVETLGFLGDLSSGLLYLAARFFGYDAPVSPSPAADYGTKFLLVAGLLNVLCILDAYDIAIGKKT